MDSYYSNVKGMLGLYGESRIGNGGARWEERKVMDLLFL